MPDNRRKEICPQIGDYIYFRWKNARDTVTVSHVGIVLTVENGVISTVEGNSGKKVAKRSYALGDERIVGFGHPKYNVVISEEKAIQID